MARVLSFSGGEWLEVDSSQSNADEKPRFVGDFKLLTYNLMSRNNFKKSLIDLMNDHEDSVSLDRKSLDAVDRMERFEALLAESSADFVLLQECEEYEEERLRRSDFIRKNYFICANGNCAILTKMKPASFELLNLSANSNKQALVVRIEMRTSSLGRVERMTLVNIHLTSDKSKNYHEKRQTQLETLSDYVLGEDLRADYVIIGGDFNFGDESDKETSLIRRLFLEKGFADLCPDIVTFDPLSNFAACLTSSKNYGRRLDRVLFKAFGSDKCRLESRYLIGTAPFKVNARPNQYQLKVNIIFRFNHFFSSNCFTLLKLFSNFS